MKIKVLLKNANPAFFEDILPIMSDELVLQVKERKRVFIIEQSEYDDLLTELSAIKNHSEDCSPDYLVKIDDAIDDFVSGWSYVFEDSVRHD
jgi:hypothetical protein